MFSHCVQYTQVCIVIAYPNTKKDKDIYLLLLSFGWELHDFRCRGEAFYCITAWRRGEQQMSEETRHGSKEWSRITRFIRKLYSLPIQLLML
jgi:hypothetical protein